MLSKNIMLFHSKSITYDGGEERVITQYANHFVAVGANVTIAHFGKANKCLFPLDSRVQIKRFRKSRILLIINFVTHVLKFQPDIIINIDLVANRYAAIAKYINKKIIVIGTEHFFAGAVRKIRFGNNIAGIKKHLYCKLDYLVVLTHASKHWLQQNTTLKNIEVIANPLHYPLKTMLPILKPQHFIKNLFMIFYFIKFLLLLNTE